MSKVKVEELQSVHDVAEWIATHRDHVILEDDEGKPIVTMLPYEEYMALLNDHEELADLRAIAKARASNEPNVPLEDALRELDAQHGIAP